MASAAGKIANELKTLTTYLTTTPPQQLDAGYIDSQAAYLARQVETLQSEGGTTSSAVASFDAAIRKLSPPRLGSRGEEITRNCPAQPGENRGSLRP